MMWTAVRQEIERERKALGLTPAQFSPVGMSEWDRIARKVEAAFREPVVPAKRRPLLWTQLRPELPTAVLADSGSEKTLPQLRPPWAAEEPLFFFAKEDVTNPKMRGIVLKAPSPGNYSYTCGRSPSNCRNGA
jgi:hypothetical protein